MLLIPEDLEGLFRNAGWAPGHSNPAASQLSSRSNAHAAAILQELGGLEVGVCSPGQEQATSNVRFLAEPRPAKRQAVAHWEGQLGPLSPIADAHHDHMIIFVSEVGAYYFFTDPDQKLYFGGSSFAEAMRRLLLGLSFGPEIAINGGE